MDLTLESKACRACARSKRKCGRQIPTCGRCLSKGIRCHYDTAKASIPFPRDGVDEMVDVLDTSSLNINTLVDLPEDNLVMHTDNNLFPPDWNINLPSSGTNSDRNSSEQPLPWYLTTDSWEMDHVAQVDYDSAFCSTVLNSSIEELQGWLGTWVNTGSCPFIHTRIYKHRFPRCVQDAYTTLSTYQNRTPENKVMIAALVEERVKQLLNDQPARTTGEEDDSSFSGLSPFQHLSRVHALLVYQAIGLYDGDIRLRHVAETQIPTLNSWLRQLIKCAKLTARDGPENFISLLFPSNQTQQNTSYSSESTTTSELNNEAVTAPNASSLLSSEDIEWYAWLFAETIRRTWTAGCSIQTIYLFLQVGWAPCPGGVPFTAREGAFSAGSAFTWASRCGGSERHKWAETDFIRRFQGDLIFEQRCPEEVDEFASHIFQISYGSERVERWRIQKGIKN